jgi:subtilisin-like proprotein convertase family protein
MNALGRLGIVLGIAWAIGAGLAPGPAAAVSPTDTVVVCGTDNFYFNDFQGFQVKGSIDEAVTFARTQGAIKTILVVKRVTDTSQKPGIWAANVTYQSGDTFGLEGYPAGHPEDVLVVASDGNLPVIDLNSAGSGVTIEGLTLTGGKQGIRVGGGQPTIQRCYIRDNREHGILCEGSAQPNIYNCSIVHNGSDGISVNAPTAGGATTILQCSIIENGHNGVYVADGSQAYVCNSLVFKNALGDQIYTYLVNDTGVAPSEWSWMPGSEWQYGTPVGAGATAGLGNPDPVGAKTGSYIFGAALGSGGISGQDINSDGDYEVGSGVEWGGGMPVTTVNDRDTTSTLKIDYPSPLYISDVDVKLNITHPADQELAVWLESPAGARIQLFHNVGGTGADFTNTVLDDEANPPVTIGSGAAPFTGSFIPEQPLAKFRGEDARGDWRLILYDAGECGLLSENFDGGQAPDWTDGGWHVVTDALGTSYHPDHTVNGRNTVSLYQGSDPNVPKQWADYTYGSMFSLPPTGGGQPTYSSTDMRTIGPGITTSSLSVPDLMLIHDISAEIGVVEQIDSLIGATLIAPDGTRVTLFDRGTLTGQHLKNTGFKDGSPALSGGGPYPGTFQPQESLLAALRGRSAQGNWQLEIQSDPSPPLLPIQDYTAIPVNTQPPGWIGNGWVALPEVPIPTNQVYRISDLSVAHDPVTLFSSSDALQWEDYSTTYMMEWAQAAGSDFGGGFVFRCAGPLDYYWLRVRAAGTPPQWYVELVKVLGGEEQVLQSVRLFRAWGQNVMMNMGVDVIGEQITLHVGATTLGPFTDPGTTLQAGSIGMRSDNAIFAFDNVLVTNLARLKNWSITVTPSYQFGWLVRAQDDRNYYMVRGDSSEGQTQFKVVKAVDGVESDLTAAVPWNPPTDEKIPVQIVVTGNQIACTVGTTALPLVVDSDASPYLQGTVGVMASGVDVGFDDVCVGTRGGGPATGTVTTWSLIIGQLQTLTVSGLNFSGYDDVSMRFERWLNTDQYARAVIDATNNTGTMTTGPVWLNVWDKGNAGIFDGDASSGGVASAQRWQTLSCDLSSVADNQPNVDVRWGYEATDARAVKCSGWNMDDIRFFGRQTGDLYGGLVAQSGGGAVLDSAFNDVFANGRPPDTGMSNAEEEFVNVTSNTGSIQVDPELDLKATWLGKLVVRTAKLPPAEDVRDQGSPSCVPSGEPVDFEFEARPAGAGPDIGADETGSGGYLRWRTCYVFPDPCPAVGPGGLTVVVWFDGGALDPNAGMFVVPQGSNVDDPNQRIYIQVTNHDTGRGGDIYWGTNVQAIQTSLDGNMPPLPGDRLADGHAVVYLQTSLGIMGRPPGDNTGIDVQARVGRHFLIDTVLPRLMLAQAPFLSPIDCVQLLNGAPYAALGAGLSLSHPYGPLPPDVAQVLGTGAPLSRAVSAPCAPDPGPPPGGLAAEDTKVFFNVGSNSNGYDVVPDHAALKVLVKAHFEDWDVYRAYGLDDPGLPSPRPLPALDADPFYGGSTRRQVAGFDNLGFAPTVTWGLPVTGTQADAALPASWVIDHGAAALAGVYVAMQPTTGGSNAGFFPAYQGSDVLEAQWGFNMDAPAAAQGIPRINVADSIELAGVFIAKDRAQNAMDTQAEINAHHKLHLYWILGNELQTGLAQAGETGIFPNIQWPLARGDNPYGIVSGPTVMYTYRVWTCNAHGDRRNTRGDTYDSFSTSVSPWSDWSEWAPNSPGQLPGLSGTQLSDLNRFLPPSDSIVDRCILVTVSVVDEAGNVAPFDHFGVVPNLELLPGNSRDQEKVIVQTTAESGYNWRRFYIPGAVSAIDTTLTAKFTVLLTDGLEDLGAATILEYPRDPKDPAKDVYIQAVFDIEAIASGIEPADRVYILATLDRDGVTEVRLRLLPDSGYRVRLPLPLPPALAAVNEDLWPGHDTSDPDYNVYPRDPNKPFRLGDPEKVVNYVLHAQAMLVPVDQSGNPRWDYARSDATPANFFFKVVPMTVEQYLEASGGKQPIKVFERE